MEFVRSKTTNRLAPTVEREYIGRRNKVSEVLAEDVRKKYSENITFFYNHRCTVWQFHSVAMFM